MRAFILPNFVIVVALASLYAHFGGMSLVTAIFYGISPAVIALILQSCYRLAELGMEDWLQMRCRLPCLFWPCCRSALPLRPQRCRTFGEAVIASRRIPTTP
jgi:Chromate transporter